MIFCALDAGWASVAVVFSVSVLLTPHALRYIFFDSIQVANNTETNKTHFLVPRPDFIYSIPPIVYSLRDLEHCEGKANGVRETKFFGDDDLQVHVNEATCPRE